MREFASGCPSGGTSKPEGAPPENLLEGLVRERARARDLLRLYAALGPEGLFGSRVIEEALAAADRAVAAADLVAMIRAYKQLQALE